MEPVRVVLQLKKNTLNLSKIRPLVIINFPFELQHFKYKVRMQLLKCVGEMLEKDHWMMLFKLSEQPSSLFGRQGLVGGDFTQKLLEALQGCCLSLVLVLLWRHLLAEGECCNREGITVLMSFFCCSSLFFLTKVD